MELSPEVDLDVDSDVEVTEAESEAHPDLRVRRVRFDWDGVPVRWLPDDPTAGHVINVIHVLLPPGERWFVEVYRDALDEISDPRLRTEMRAFMGQEAVHGRSHAGFVDHMDANGYETAPLVEGVEGTIRFWERLGTRLIGRRATRKARVAVIAGIEHYTAVLGEWALTSEVFDRGDPVVADILRWHGAEELEHKCVAFDVHTELSGSYMWRIIGYGMATIQMLWWWRIGTRHLLARDPELGVKGWRRRVFASVRAGNLPGRELIAALFSYFRPGFHPSHRPTLELSRAYLARSPAVAEVA